MQWLSQDYMYYYTIIGCLKPFNLHVHYKMHAQLSQMPENWLSTHASV